MIKRLRIISITLKLILTVLRLIHSFAFIQILCNITVCIFHNFGNFEILNK